MELEDRRQVEQAKHAQVAREGKDLEPAPPGDGFELRRYVRLIGVQPRYAPRSEDGVDRHPRAPLRVEAAEPLLQLGGRGGG